jgi:outer membrane receptor protein involved in Fe transport
MNHTLVSRIFTAVILLSCSVASFATESIDEIIVTADFRERPASELPGSVTLFGADDVRRLAVQHFEELVNVVPNLNWSGDGHRARYLQIRGVGELEQYQGAPNPSVGFLIDDIDFSGIGTIATLFDIERIEVLRGPQGTRYGANALGGLVYVQSALPTSERDGRLQVTAGDDDTRSGGLAFGGSLTQDERLLFRASGHYFEGNGFRNNTYLGREDTNGREETTLRGRLRWLGSDELTIDLAFLYTNVDNGYDAFAIDNSYTMLSDKPGKDAQESVGSSLRIEWAGLDRATFTSITAFADSEIDFSFDADWGNEDAWAPVTYDFVSLSDRTRRTFSQEFRFTSTERGRLFGGSTDWLFGLYVLNLEDGLLTVNQGEYFDPGFDFADSLDDTFASDYEATNVAAFGQLERPFGSATRLSFGLRVEHRSTDYSDTAGLQAGPSETMTGGDITLSHDHSETLTSFLSLSKGYKAGGFNLGIVPEGRREFGAETAWNFEAGIKSTMLDDSVWVNVSAFYSQRDDQQVRTSFQLVPNDPASFVFFTDNAAKGETLGLEADLRWFVTESLELYGRQAQTTVIPRVFLRASTRQDATRSISTSVTTSDRRPMSCFTRASATRRSAGPCSSGDAICSTRNTRYAGSTSAMSRRFSRIPFTRGWAMRASSVLPTT